MNKSESNLLYVNCVIIIDYLRNVVVLAYGFSAPILRNFSL